MDFTQLANLGEFVGGIAVVVTLIYLVLELHRDRAENRGGSELCEISMRGNINPEELDPVERTRYLAVTQRLINHFMTIKRSRDRGVLPDEEWLAYGVGTANFLDSPGGEWACKAAATTDDVRNALRELRSQSDKSAEFTHWKGMAAD